LDDQGPGLRHAEKKQDLSCWMIKVLGHAEKNHDLLLNDQGSGTWLTVGWSRSWDMTYCWMIKVLGHDLLLDDQGSGTWLTIGWSRSWDMQKNVAGLNLLPTLQTFLLHNNKSRPSWAWLYGSWIYNYIWNQCLSPLGWGVLDTTLCDKDCQWHATGHSFYPGTPVSSTNKTDRRAIAEILLKVALNIIT
jgi:hypothetical protein